MAYNKSITISYFTKVPYLHKACDYIILLGLYITISQHVIYCVVIIQNTR